MQMLAIDLGKQSFHVHGVSADGEVVSRRIGRQKLAALVESLDPKVIAMEACATAHYWARLFMGSGRQVRLINPHFVKPFVRGSKNDAVDADAIFDAASRPTMRFVPVETEAQQDLQSLHRVRDRLVSQRTRPDQSHAWTDGRIWFDLPEARGSAPPAYSLASAEQSASGQQRGHRPSARREHAARHRFRAIQRGSCGYDASDRRRRSPEPKLVGSARRNSPRPKPSGPGPSGEWDTWPGARS